MSNRLAHCPHLPVPEDTMSHRCLTDLDPQQQPGSFYFKALQYGNYLWANGHAGRAILAITRGLYSNVSKNDPILQEWALPYAALRWIIENHSSNDFPGNPRISFQHQATRLRGERQALKRARAWAFWAIICEARPSLPPDSVQKFDPLTPAEIFSKLKNLGHSGEVELWALIHRANSNEAIRP